MDTIIDRNDSDALIEEILKIDPAIKAAHDKMERLKSDPEFMRLYYLREKALSDQQ